MQEKYNYEKKNIYNIISQYIYILYKYNNLSVKLIYKVTKKYSRYH